MAAAHANAASTDVLASAKRGDLAALAAASDEALRAVDAFGSNALHWAAGRGRLACVRHLVEDRGMEASARAEPKRPRDAPTTRGRTALHYAARNGHLAVVEYLVARPGVDADARAEGGVSPAQLACWRNEFAVVRRLVDGAGVDVAQKNAAGCGFAHWLACAPRDRGDLLPLATWLTARLGADALAAEANGHGHTCLHKAAFAGHAELSAYLVSCGRGVFVFRVDGVTRHAIDALWGRVNGVKRLTSRRLGADDGVVDETGGRPSDEADAAGHGKLRDFLRLRADRGKAAQSRAALGLAPEGALDAAAVRDAFREVALATHPDRAAGGGDDAFRAARAAHDYLQGVPEDYSRATRRLPILVEALGPTPGDPRVHIFAAQVVAAILEHGDGGLSLAHLPKKFRLLWRTDFSDAAAAAGLPQRGVKRVLWRVKYAVRLGKGEAPLAFSRVRCAEVRARIES